VPILVADTVTCLADRHAHCVLVTGSHGGIIAAHYAARARVRAAIFNDAGGGCEGAGIAGLAWLEALGIAAAAVSHATARIADAHDSLAHGVVSHANAIAASLGVAPGLSCAMAAQRLQKAAPATPSVPDLPGGDGRWILAPASGEGVEVAGLDSIGAVVPGDAGRVLVIGSHGGLHGGDPASALPVEARAAFFHDAGVGKDGAGITRLPVLAQRGLPAGTVDYRTARIGDARSLWATGVLSHVNAPLAALGVAPGTRVQAACCRVRGLQPT
jgi:hypothetical protein